MSKKRLPSVGRSTRRTNPPRLRGDRQASSVQLEDQNFHRFLGLSLSGGKSDRSCLALIDFFDHPGRIFLNRLYDRIKTHEHISADLRIHEHIQFSRERCHSITFDVPLSLPKCLRCDLKCPGFETCSEPEIKWMRSVYGKIEKLKPKKYFTPYTQRPVDLQMQTVDKLEVHHALSANLGPLTARAIFLARRVDLKAQETNTRVAVWRLGQSLKIRKSYLHSFRNSVGGEDARKHILQALAEALGIFIYDQDRRSIIESHHAFDAFICALVGYLDYQQQCEPRPAGFPREEQWALIPSLSR